MEKALTVSDVNRYIKEIISRDLILSGLWVRGEVSNFKFHYSGHLYFTLKDDKSTIKCVMFKSHAAGMKFNLENGMKVVIRGYISVFERDGQYQLYAEEIQPDGIGALHIAFEQLKSKLENEGLFSPDKKKRLPFLPASIGVITSSTGAVIKDIINVLTRRYYNIELKLFPVQVQGEQAAAQIAHAIDKLNELSLVDVIILARGGGSLEDLWPFNEEIVARSIFSSEIPVISAVGHETDFTIADFTADCRAPTPSAAAEIVVPEKTTLSDRVINLDRRLKGAISKKIELNRLRLGKINASTVFRQPFNRIYQERMKLDQLDRYLVRAVRNSAEMNGRNLASLVGRLDALSPLAILSRGYGIIRDKKSGTTIKSIGQLQIHGSIEVRLIDGYADCTVENIKGQDDTVGMRGKNEY